MTLNPPGMRSTVHGGGKHLIGRDYMERASTEADAKERNQPIVVNLMVTASTPAPVTGSPVEPEKSRAARAGLLHARQHCPKLRPKQDLEKKSADR